MKETPAAPIARREPRPGRRARRRTETRERIFRAALRLLAERGFTATTVEDITEAADVGKGTFFNYFPSKEHVLAAFGEMQVGKIQAALSDPRVASGPVREILHGMIRALAEEPGRSPGLVRAIMMANLASAPVRELMLRNLARAREALAHFFAEARRHRRVRRDLDPAQAAAGMQRMFFGTLFLWAIDPAGKLEARFEKAFELFWRAVAPGTERGKEKRS